MNSAGFNLRTALDGHEKAQNKKHGAEPVFMAPVRVSTSAKLAFD
jgi:hypothetical protein